MNCRHWDNGCRLGLYGGYPSPGVCRQCTSYRGPWRGMGDVVRSIVRVAFLGRTDVAERIAGWVERQWRNSKQRGSAPLPIAKEGGCGCKARQQALNRAIPFKRHAH